MRALYDALLHSTGWLYLVIVRWGPFYIDLWTFPHILSGFGLMAIFVARNLRLARAWFWTLVILTAYELLELLLLFLSVDVFLPEVLIDKLNDIVVGTVAAWFAEWAGNRYRLMIRPLPGLFAIIPGNAVFFAVGLAFFWTGIYGYHYNVAALNSPGMSWWAFLLWVGGLLYVLGSYALLRLVVANGVLRVTLAVGAYWLALITLEFIGYNMFGIRETTNGNAAPMIGNLIHGNGLLHFFYFVAAPLIIGLNVAGEWLLGWHYQPLILPLRNDQALPAVPESLDSTNPD